MTKTQTAVITLGILAATVLGANSAFAHGGEGHKRFGDDDRFRLVPSEMRAEWKAEKKAELAELSVEERQAYIEEMRTERKEYREERKQAIEDFTGLSREEIREAKKNGESVGDILEGQGISEAETETFLTEQANLHVDMLIDRHDLSEEDEQTLLDRIDEFVADILDRWFGQDA